jgi:hypothetical protein
MTAPKLKVVVLLAAVAGTLPACGSPKKVAFVQEVAYRPDGSLVLFTEAGIHVYNGGLEWNFIPFDALMVQQSSASFRYSLSADGTRAAVSYSPYYPPAPTRVAIYAIPDGDLLNLFQLDPSASNGEIALSPDGKLLFALGARTMLDTTTGAPLWTGNAAWLLPVWSADGTTLFIDDTGAFPMTLTALEANTGKAQWKAPLNVSYLLGLTLVWDGTVLAGLANPLNVGYCPGATYGYGLCPNLLPFWYAADGTLAAQQTAVPGATAYGAFPDTLAAFACNTDTCVAGLRDNTATVDGEFAWVYKVDGTFVARLPTEGAAPSFSISPDGTRIAMASDQDKAHSAQVFSLPDGQLIGSIDLDR